MNLTKLNPFNWLRKEQEQSIPVQRVQTPPAVSSPMTSYLELHREMDRLFDDFIRGYPLASFDRLRPLTRLAETESIVPRLDIAESDHEYTITVDLPGVSEKDLKLEIQGDTLRIGGERRMESEERRQNYHRIERSYGSFERILNLPGDADAEKITAKFKDGVLSVAIPRLATAKPAVRQIEVKSA